MKRTTKDFLYFIGIHLTALSLLLLTSGCATEGKSVGLGGAFGAGTGALLGAIADPGKRGEYRTRNVVVGAAVGGMAGLVAGAMIHDQTEKKKKEAFLEGRASASQASGQGAMPALSQPKVETHWIEGKVIGNRYIEGHFEYVIVEPVRWENRQ